MSSIRMITLILSFVVIVESFQLFTQKSSLGILRGRNKKAYLKDALDTRTLDPPIGTPEENIGAWIPIASASSLDGLGPQQVMVMGLELVVWKGPDEIWSVMSDVCPHRLAPLSQGRLDPTTGCIECPYHGWQFNTEGNLTSLPHIDEGTEVKEVANSRASYFPTHLCGDLIFAFLPSSVHGEMFSQSILPEQMFPTLAEDVRKNCTYYVRELPYSADFAIENFMDPSHIPFAHHSLQSVRSDSAPMPMDVLVSNFTHVEVTFKDASRGKQRDGVASFQRPTMYHFRTKDGNGTSKTRLNIHIVPVRAGRCRVLFANFPAPPIIPRWLLHAGSNRFLNTDVWLHEAELITRSRSEKKNPYLYASQADRGVLAFRRWWARNGFSTAPRHTFGPAQMNDLTRLGRRQQIDPWEYHARQCSVCRKALRVMKRVQGAGLLTALMGPIFLRKRPVLATLFVAFGLVARQVATKFSTVIEGNPHPGEIDDRSVAHQQPNDKLDRKSDMVRKAGLHKQRNAAKA